MFANGPGDWSSIPGRVIPRTCITLNIIRYRSRVKWSNQGNGVAPSSTPWYSSYWKGNPLVAHLTLLRKFNIECFGCNNFLQDFRFIKNVKIAMDVWWNNRRKESVCIKRKIHNGRIYFLIYFNIYIYIYIYIYMYIYTNYRWSYLPNPSAQAGYDTRSIF